MHKRIIGLFVSVGLLAAGAIQTRAAGEGTIQISPQRNGMLVAGGEVTVYRVGYAVEDGYRLSAGVADWIVEEADIYDPQLAVWIRESTTEEGNAKTVGPGGSVTFSGLDAGVYLVNQTEPAPGYQSFEPFLVVLPLTGPRWEVPCFPKVDKIDVEPPKTGDPTTLFPGVVGMVLSGTGMTACIRRRRKAGKA